MTKSQINSNLTPNKLNPSNKHQMTCKLNIQYDIQKIFSRVETFPLKSP